MCHIPCKNHYIDFQCIEFIDKIDGTSQECVAYNVKHDAFHFEEVILHFVQHWPDKVKNLLLSDLKFQCEDINKCVAQQNIVFGFVPLSSLKQDYVDNSDPRVILIGNDFDPVHRNKEVRATNTYNCLEAKVH